MVILGILIMILLLILVVSILLFSRKNTNINELKMAPLVLSRIFYLRIHQMDSCSGISHDQMISDEDEVIEVVLQSVDQARRSQDLSQMPHGRMYVQQDEVLHLQLQVFLEKDFSRGLITLSLAMNQRLILVLHMMQMDVSDQARVL